MHTYFHIFSLSIPGYGLCIASGVVLANLIALCILKKSDLDVNDFIILESYCFLGAFIGAKLLYLVVSYRQIQWNRFFEPQYFNALMQGGFVFYGGLIGGLLFVFAGSRIHRIEPMRYIRSFIFLIPFIHGFGRVGCFMAGCCYGKPYHGVGAVVFPEGSFAPAGIELFPVQLVEAVLLILISILLLVLQLKIKWIYTIETYLIIYGIVRFFLEYMRYDEERGSFGWLSTSQWISIGLIIGAMISLIFNCRRTKVK